VLSPPRSRAEKGAQLGERLAEVDGDRLEARMHGGFDPIPQRARHALAAVGAIEVGIDDAKVHHRRRGIEHRLLEHFQCPVPVEQRQTDRAHRRADPRMPGAADAQSPVLAVHTRIGQHEHVAARSVIPYARRLLRAGVHLRQQELAQEGVVELNRNHHLTRRHRAGGQAQQRARQRGAQKSIGHAESSVDNLPISSRESTAPGARMAKVLWRKLRKTCEDTR
jgi:hypothetical protein